jgi:hypothetical protein
MTAIHSNQHVIHVGKVIIDIRERFSERGEGGQQGQQPAFSNWLHYESVTLLVDDGFLTLKLELARYSYCLVAPVTKETHVAFSR